MQYILTSFTVAVKTKTNLVKIVLPVIACLLLPICIALVCIYKFKSTIISALFSCFQHVILFCTNFKEKVSILISR